jgi:hypothetical protein
MSPANRMVADRIGSQGHQTGPWLQPTPSKALYRWQT